MVATAARVGGRMCVRRREGSVANLTLTGLTRTTQLKSKQCFYFRSKSRKDLFIHNYFNNSLIY